HMQVPHATYRRQETRSGLNVSLLTAKPLVARFLISLPHADQLDLGNELHLELLQHLSLGQGHERADVAGLRGAGVDDEVRVLRADHRAADRPALEARGLDEPPREVARRVAEDRSGVRLRQRLLLDAL